MISRSLLFAAMLSTASLCSASSFANGYNALVFGNFTSSNTDVGGSLAVGANATLSNFALNGAGSLSNVINGALTLSNGSINGKTYVGTATISNAGVCPGCLQIGANASSPLNVSSLLSPYQQLNQNYFGLASTGNVASQYGNLILTGDATRSLNVFNVSSAQLSGSTPIDIRNIGSGATILINVSGSGSASTSSAGLAVNGSQVQGAQNVLFNFNSGISSISIANSFYTSLLAPNANVTAGYGQFDGSLVAANYNGNIEFHDYQFTGTIGDPGMSTAPEPATNCLFAAATFLICGVLRFRRASFARCA